MELPEYILGSDTARAARALARVSVSYVAGRAELDPGRVQAFERYEIDLTDEEKRRLRRSFEEVGVVFLDDDSFGGYGVRRKFTRAKVKRLETWEGEGGLASEDDI